MNRPSSRWMPLASMKGFPEYRETSVSPAITPFAPMVSKSSTAPIASLLLHFVPKSPHHLQVARIFRIDLDFLADSADVDSHRILGAEPGLFPDPLVNLV